MECYRTIFLSGTEGGEVLYMGNMEIKKQKLNKWSGRSTVRDKRDTERTTSRPSKEKLEHDTFHGRQQEVDPTA